MDEKELLNNPKIRAMLNVIRTAEGADYNTRVGGGKFSDLSKKPGQKVYIKSINDYSSAEGAYQFLNKTWDGVSKKLGLKDFSPQSQDLAAVYLIKQRGAVDDILNDNFESAINKLSLEWASLPTSKGNSAYKGQKARKIEQLKKIYGQPIKEQETVQKQDSFVSPVDFSTPQYKGTVFNNSEEEEKQQAITEKQVQNQEPEDKLLQESFLEQQSQIQEPQQISQIQYDVELQPIEYQPINVQELQDGGTINNLTPEQSKIVFQDVNWLNNWLSNRVVQGQPLPKDFKKADVKKVYTDVLEDPNQYGEFDPYYGRIILSEDRFTTKPNIATHELTHQVQDRNPYFPQFIKEPITKVIDPNSYTSQPEEIHSELMRLRQAEGYDPAKEVTKEQVDKIKNIESYNLKDLNKDQLLQLLNTTAYNKQREFNYYAQNGGEIPVSSKGMWEYPNQPVIVPTLGSITMENMDYPVFGKSLETGEIKLMQPNKNYFFKNTKNVLEIPHEKKQ